MNKETIVVVEDEVDIREVLIYNLKREGYQVFGEADGIRGLQIIQEKQCLRNGRRHGCAPRCLGITVS